VPGSEIIGGPGSVLIDSGAKAAATTYASPSWATNAYDVVELWARLGSFNGGAVWQAYWQFQGPANNTYCSSHDWGSTASGVSFAAQGNPGGGRAELLEDQLNSAVERVIHGVFFPRMRFGKVTTYALATGAGNALQWTEARGASTDMATAVTGITLDFNGNSLSITDLTIVGARYR